MTNAILTIAASLVSILASYYIWNIILKPLFQRFTNWVDTYKNEQAIGGAVDNNQNQNSKDQNDQNTRNGAWDKLTPKP